MRREQNNTTENQTRQEQFCYRTDVIEINGRDMLCGNIELSLYVRVLKGE